MDAFEVAAKVMVNGLSGSSIDLRNYCDVNSYDANSVLALLKPFADITTTSTGSPVSRTGQASIASTSGRRPQSKTVSITLNEAGRAIATGKTLEQLVAALRASS